MTNDRFGMRWGLAGGTTLASINDARDAARFAEKAGFDSFWISHAMGVDPIVALACIGGDFPGIGEVGTSVVPLYSRHPVGLAQLARTAQNALGGRFTLGVGAASKRLVEDVLGLTWDKPYSYTREFLEALEPLLAGEQADTDGEQISAHAKLGIEAQPTPILLAALGPRMLRFAGSRLQGTTLGQCGPRTISSYILPHLQAGAEGTDRSGSPRVMALVRICVTDDFDGAKSLAREIADNNSAVSLAMCRQMLWKMTAADHPMDAHKIDTRGIRAMRGGGDAREGIASFLEKRPANFPLRVSQDMPDFYPWWPERIFD